MKKVIILLMTFFFALIVVIGILFGVNYMSGDADINIENLTDNTDVSANGDPNGSTSEGGNATGALTCFDFIDRQLVADGFTYLQDAKWGRGVQNNFIIDVVEQEFQMTNYMIADTYDVDWYKDYEEWVSRIYSYKEDKIFSGAFYLNGASRDEEVYLYNYVSGDVQDHYYELKGWMEYYHSQFNKAGCSIEDITLEKLTEEYKTTKSNANPTDVVSVFDRKSDDGVLRYFADVHVKGNIEDNPRYKELNSKEEYLALHDAENQEQVYFVNVLYKDPTKILPYEDLGSLQGSAVFREFTKDVVFTQTSWIEENPNQETIGAYFIYVDNPNGNFAHFYKPFERSGSKLLYSLTDFDSIKTPFDGFIMLVNKSDVARGKVYEINPQRKVGTLDFYLTIIKEFYPDFEYSEDFVTNYTRPFNHEWQKMMGLEAHFEEKYGLLEKGIKTAEWGD